MTILKNTSAGLRYGLLGLAFVFLAAVVSVPARVAAEPVATSQTEPAPKASAAPDAALPSAPRAAQIEPMVDPVKREAPVAPESKAKRSLVAKGREKACNKSTNAGKHAASCGHTQTADRKPADAAKKPVHAVSLQASSKTVAKSAKKKPH
jgi:hypothetical protein